MPAHPPNPPDCQHRVVSLPPAAHVGTCLECRAEVDVRLLERLWAARAAEEEQETAGAR